MTALRQDVGTTAVPFVAGDYRILRFSAEEADGSPMNLTGHTIRWGLYAWSGGPRYSSPESTAVVSKTTTNGIVITDPVGGVFEVTLEPADTDSIAVDGPKPSFFWHEAEVVDTLGRRFTVATGHFQISFQRVV
jgi:hypothetical protein